MSRNIRAVRTGLSDPNALCMPATSPKRVGVDLLLLSQFSYTGIISYTQAILPHLIGAFPEWEWILFCRSERLGFDYSRFRNVRIKKSKWMSSHWLWKLVGVSAESMIEKLDLLFLPVSRLPLWKTCPSAAVIYDLGFLSSPEYLRRGSITKTAISVRHAVRNCDILLTLTEFTKSEICAKYGNPPNGVTVTHCGYDASKFHAKKACSGEAATILQRYGIRVPYVLYLGVIQGRKNLVKLIEASERWRIADPELQLVLAGKRGWNCDQIYERAARFSASELCMPGPIRQEDMQVIYQMAECYVLPSIYEGFGIPAVEAMACGTPVVLSATTALPEVGGSAALYFDPQRPEEIAERVLMIRNSPEVRGRMVAAGLERVKQFTWAQCASRIVDSFQSFFRKHGPPEKASEETTEIHVSAST